MRRVIFNQKGGVGKSTITCNLAAISAAEGARTLVIDLDMQGNSTHYLLGHTIDDPEATIAHLFKESLSLNPFGKSNETGIAGAIHPTPFDNLSVVPPHPDLEALQSRLESRYKIYKLKEALDQLDSYDAIFIDTPPLLNFYSRSALIAADNCLIPFDCDVFSQDALNQLMGALGEVKSDHNQRLSVEGIVVNQFQSRANLPQKLVDALIDAGHPVLKSHISPSVKVRESHSASKPLIHYSPEHKLAHEFRALFKELQEK